MARGVAVILAGYLAATLYLDVFQHNAVNWNGRIFGLSNHPNEFGISISLMLSMALLTLVKSRWTWQVFIAALWLCSTYYIYRAGSRTAGLAYLFAMIPFLLLLKRGPFLAAVVVVSGIAGGSFIKDSWNSGVSGGRIISEGRIFSTTNTRQDVFMTMFDNFVDNPVIGNPATVGGTSNSILYVASSGGLIALIIALVSLGMLVKALLRVQGAIVFLPDGKIVSAYLWSSFGAIAVSLMFSGFLLEYVQYPLLYLILFVVIVAALDGARSRMMMSSRGRGRFASGRAKAVSS